jgi:2-polyprenyl-3-methyl-5-hydroxy-6-metoxy-1,4-benzoquinol methylase
MSGSETKCRVCSTSAPRLLGEVEYFSGFAWQIRECSTCGCRFTQHETSIYDKLHASGAISYYSDYKDLAAECAVLFNNKDASGLRELLCQSSKYRFVIDEIERSSADARLLEVGCSRGYLTSYFILTGRQVRGCDVSQEAVESAKQAFGEHFNVNGSLAIRNGAPYDIIYHVGMIGCVADPVGLTRDLLTMLRPGGSLIFNAPNVGSCYLDGQLWIDSAPPPDLVTLFPPGFWSRQLANIARVQENVEMRKPDQSLKVGLAKFFHRHWKKPVPLRLDRQQCSAPSRSEGLWGSVERVILKAGRISGLSRLAAKQPSEFGIYVKATKSE